MHGLINRAIQCFVRDSYGRERWIEITHLADLGFSDFEAMLHYDDALTEKVLEAVSRSLGVARDTVLEDIGTYLVSHPNAEALRRLLRFGGDSFVDFLHSLDELPDRTRLAVDDLVLPQLELREYGENSYSLICDSDHGGFGHVLIGVLRTLADDYGALVFLEHKGGQPGREVIEITLIEAAFAEGRSFDLGAKAG